MRFSLVSIAMECLDGKLIDFDVPMASKSRKSQCSRQDRINDIHCRNKMSRRYQKTEKGEAGEERAVFVYRIVLLIVLYCTLICEMKGETRSTRGKAVRLLLS